MTVLVRAVLVLGQVTEGETEVVSLRETDERLGALVYALIGLGVAALVATVIFWFATRPGRRVEGN